MTEGHSQELWSQREAGLCREQNKSE